MSIVLPHSMELNYATVCHIADILEYASQISSPIPDIGVDDSADGLIISETLPDCFEIVCAETKAMSIRT